MAIPDLASQLPYVGASVLIVSALLKIGTRLPKESPQEISKIALMRDVYLWFIELVVAVSAIVFASHSGDARMIALLVGQVLFCGFFVMCLVDVLRHTKSSCLCFGGISKKPPRPLSCVRNGVLFGLWVVGSFAHPSALTLSGVIMSLVVLGAILYEEIR
ncbi:MAG TPA: hypothetical protein PKB15_06010 [Acidimicrobiia bacterium]|nr:hypothetical protein [Acidimicrobiia bacterium]